MDTIFEDFIDNTAVRPPLVGIETNRKRKRDGPALQQTRNGVRLFFHGHNVAVNVGENKLLEHLLNGIYVGDDKVIHFTRRGREVGTGTAIDLFLISSGPVRSQEPCSSCSLEMEGHGVVSSCLNCFLSGGILYRFEYGVNPSLFLAKARGGTCTLASSDPDDVTIHRAKYLLTNGFGCYNMFKNNCEDFAIYCKTGLLVVDQGTMGQSGQAASIIGGPLAAVLSSPLRLVTSNVYGMAAIAIGVYCGSRYAADIGMRSDVVKVSVEDLTRRLATGLFRVAEQQIIPTPLLESPRFVA